MDKITIGIIAKPQGVKGELKMVLLTDDFNTVKDVKEVTLGEKFYKIENIRTNGKDIFIKLFGVDDRNSAELLRSVEVYATKDQLNVAKGRYFIGEVLGSEVVLTSGKVMGKVKEIFKSNVDMYYIETSEGLAVFPLLKELLVEFDIENKKIVVDAKKFTEVVFYEN